MAITTGQATPNYSQSFSPAYGNPLIAALRANSPAPARQASGIEDISTGKIFNTPKDATWVDSPQRVRDKAGNGGTTSTAGGTNTTAGTNTTGGAGTTANNWITDPVISAPYVSPGPKSKTYQTNWDDLNSTYADDYTKAKASGVTDADWANSPKFKAYQTEVILRAANTFDTDKLASDIASMEQGFDNPVYGDNFRKIVAAEKARLEYLTRTGQGGPGQGEQEFETDYA